MPRDQPPHRRGSSDGPSIVLTPRGRLVLTVLAVLAVVALVLGVRGVLTGGSATAAPTRGTTGSPAAVTTDGTSESAGSPGTGAPGGSSRTEATTTVTSKTGSSASHTTGSSPTTTAAEPEATSTGGMPHSGLVGTGKFTTSTVALAAARTTPVLHTYVVEVEGGVRTTPNAVAEQIERTLNDKRGWIGYRGASFAAVSSRAKAEFVIYLASPPTVDRMCAPLQVQSTWNCEVGKNVVLNSDRWFLMTPTYSNLTDYRAYMVNHEIGHFLGRGHVGCPKAGNPAPVMLRQSMSLEGCVRNAWPRLADIGS